ncbi:MAG TPA: aldehyde dehydrogenase family protein [Actinomycetota bacterium]|nr:aldehyde dehydrogenase family protein [Actinomycetota bacterium]
MRDVLIGGEWVRGEAAPAVVNSPWSGETVAEVSMASPEQVSEAVARASAAFAWTRTAPAAQRADTLLGAADGIRRRRAEFVETLVAEGGKPHRSAVVEVDRAISTLTWAAEEAKRFTGDLTRLDANEGMNGRLGLVRRFPLGVVAGITPFNFPLNLVCHKVGPALAAGNAIVVKPATSTPLSALMLGEVLIESGAGDSISVIPCSNEDAQGAVVDPRVAKLSFTGSTEVGWKLKVLVPRKRVTLELGGNAAVIVEPDADLDRAADRISYGGFYQAGQSCISVQRVFVAAPVYRDLLDRLVPRVEALVVGDPSDPATDVGPLIDGAALDRVDAWVREALEVGATALCGAERRDPCYAPTVLVETRPDMKVSCLEVFGPVVTVEPYRTFEEALALVNDSQYGLQAGLFTSDIRRVFLAHRELRVGGVIHDDVPSFRADQMPYGGVKDSGYGREGVRSAMLEMSEERLLVLGGLPL